ncbi:MAG TPA: PQQ-binding-like beta-propeller repeat protein [Symbiobacteriaceae bacterium]|nr:PQQ-binding-like beta-propeller repeat protein [Symbiobacteriaceae bacterium]
MVFYFVQRGETLYQIAKRYQTTVHAIVAANRLDDPNAICPGQALIIPRPGEVPSPPPGGIVHLVRAGETVFHLASKFGTSAPDILRANQIAHPEFIAAGQQLVIPERMEAGDDWPMLGRTPGRAGTGPVLLHGRPSEGWSFAPRNSLGLRPSAPVIRYDRVYVGLGDGHFYALCRKTGRVKWRLPAAEPDVLAALGQEPLAAPAVFDGLVYLCGPDGAVMAVDAHSGQHIWKIACGSRIVSSPAVCRGVVYLGTLGGQVYALEAKTGAIAWKRDVGAALTYPIAVGDDHLFACTEDGALSALDAESGDSFWQVKAEEPGAPVFAEVVVLAGGRAYDPRTGQVLWRVNAGGNLPVARVDQVIYPGGAVDLFTGSLQRAHVAGVSSLTPEPAQGEMLALPEPPTPLRAQVASGSLLIAVGEDGRLYAWDVASGGTAWLYALGGPSHQPPAIAPGQIVVALESGGMQTFQFADGPAAV